MSIHLRYRQQSSAQNTFTVAVVVYHPLFRASRFLSFSLFPGQCFRSVLLCLVRPRLSVRPNGSLEVIGILTYVATS
jgi:hypothetical protein